MNLKDEEILTEVWGGECADILHNYAGVEFACGGVCRQNIKIRLPFIELDKPVVIHSRDADEDMISMLKELGPKLRRKGVIHSFTSSLELAKTALDLDFYLGFNGIITFKKADDVREAVSLASLDRILTETDSPFLTPVPHRGKENAPYRLPHIVEKIAEIKEVDSADVYNKTYDNALRLFGL